MKPPVAPTMKQCLLILLTICITIKAHGQSQSVLGKIFSSSDSSALPGAAVFLENPTLPTKNAITDVDGKFVFEHITPGKYTLLINFLGHKPYTSPIKVQHASLNKGVIYLEGSATSLQEVKIVGNVPLGEQRGDTIQYNAAAFKVAADASAEDLLQKMPGITITDGRIQAQGENVQQVLVDGKRYFGEDVETALRNLPAEIIEHIEIFDKLSDQSEFSGFDDGKRAKTLNIVTKPNRRKGQFGKAAAGYGTNNKYMAGVSLNKFTEGRRFTVSAISNNINIQDFSVGETPGGGMRGRRGRNNGSEINQSGSSNFNNLNLNFNDKWGQKLEASGNYAFTRSDETDVQTRYRDFVAPGDSGQTYKDNSHSNSINNEHRLNLRLDYKMNKANRLLFTPNFTLNNGSSSTTRSGRTENINRILNQSENFSNASISNHTISNNINYSHRFDKPGRVFTSSLTTNYTGADNGTYREAKSIFYRKRQRVQVLDQFVDLNRTGYAWQGNMSVSERVNDSSRIQLEYKIGNKQNMSDKYAYDYVEQTGLYTDLDTTLSNVFRSEYLTQDLGLSYQYNTKKLRTQTELQYQSAQLNNNQHFPRSFVVNRSFQRVLPSAQLEYRFSKWRYMRLEYRTSTHEPTVAQLQNVIDNANQINIRTGNSDLRQSYQNRVSLRYNNFNRDKNEIFMVNLTGTLTQNAITNSTLRPDSAITIAEGVVLEKGSQLTRPVNMNGNWRVNSSVSYGKPLGFLKTNLNVNCSVGYARRPGLINDVINFSNNSKFKIGLVLSSNISKNIDFNISSDGTYSIVKNSLRPEADNNFYNQSTALRLNYTFLKGLVYRTEINHQYNLGLAPGFDSNFILWNMSLSKKMLKNNAGEFSLSVNDLLKQNSNIYRNVTDAYIEDRSTNVLQRFFMATFSYNIRKFKGKNQPAPDSKQRGSLGDYNILRDS